MSTESFEEFFNYDWYDGPISGVTNYNGTPYFFEYQGYNEIAKESYYLTPINNEILALAKESWQIWKRWEIAFHKGDISKDTHPYLPEDRERGEYIEKVLEENLRIDGRDFIECKAEFISKPNQEHVLGIKSILVKWELLDRSN